MAAQIHFIRTDRGEQPRPEWLTHVAIQDAKHDAKCAYCALIRAQKGGQN